MLTMVNQLECRKPVFKASGKIIGVLHQNAFLHLINAKLEQNLFRFGCRFYMINS